MIVPGSRTSLNFDREWERNVFRARREGLPRIRSGKGAAWDHLSRLLFGKSEEVISDPIPVVREGLREIADAVDTTVSDIEDAVDAPNVAKPGDA